MYSKALILSFTIFGLTLSVSPTLAEDKLEVSTIQTELYSHDQVHEYGKSSKLSIVDNRVMNFVKEIGLSAYESGSRYGLYPSVTIAQAILESGSGRSSLSSTPHNNLFGVKGFYQGKSVALRTKEDTGNGNMYEITANFKVYPSWSKSIEDHDQLLRTKLNGYYSGAWRENAKTPEQATKYLQGRYASDSRYSAKLNDIIETYNLKRFDDIDERDIAWLESDSLDPWERPVVVKKIQRATTWASSYIDRPEALVQREEVDKPVMAMATSRNLDTTKIAEYYVQQTLGVDEVFTHNGVARYKRNPVVGDIAVYSTENADNIVVTKYAVVENVTEVDMLISEGISINGQIKSFYRKVDNETIKKFEFISIESVAAYVKTLG